MPRFLPLPSTLLAILSGCLLLADPPGANARAAGAGSPAAFGAATDACPYDLAWTFDTEG